MRLGRGETESGGRSRPALLCATFEAFVGAIFLSEGIDFLSQYLKPLLESKADTIYTSGKLHDPKSRLQEWTQAQGYGAPTYRTISENGPDHAKIFEIEVQINGTAHGRGTGHSKQSAAKAAAQEALNVLGLS
jgi:ribonuclease-3